MISIFVQMFVRNMVLAPVPTTMGRDHCATQHESWKIGGMTRYGGAPKGFAGRQLLHVQCTKKDPRPTGKGQRPTAHGPRPTKKGPRPRMALKRAPRRVWLASLAQLKRPTCHGPRFAVGFGRPTVGGSGLDSLI